MEPLMHALEWAVHALALVAEALGVAVVAVALVRAGWHYGRELAGGAGTTARERIRLDLAHSLVLSLEFLLAADVLRTAVEPSWEEIARLAAIAAIRTVLNFFLDREIAEEERRVGERGAQGDGPSGG